jgi:hypothetical protein
MEKSLGKGAETSSAPRSPRRNRRPGGEYSLVGFAARSRARRVLGVFLGRMFLSSWPPGAPEAGFRRVHRPSSCGRAYARGLLCWRCTRTRSREPTAAARGSSAGPSSDSPRNRLPRTKARDSEDFSLLAERRVSGRESVSYQPATRRAVSPRTAKVITARAPVSQAVSRDEAARELMALACCCNDSRRASIASVSA